MVNALELFENFKNNQAKRALIEEQLRLSPLREEVLRFGLAKDRSAMERDDVRLGMLSRKQEADERFNQGRLGLMAQQAANRPRPPAPIIQTDDGIYERTASGLVPLKGPDGMPLKPKGSEAKPPKDFMWNADKTEQVVIPGSATDIKTKALKAKDFRNKALLDSSLDAEIANIDKLVNNPTGNKTKYGMLHPGLKAMVGPVDSRFPTFLTDTANAEALLKSLQSKASISSLQTIRGTSGSIGSLTEKEWPRLESLKATLQETQGTEQFVQSLKEYRDELLRIKRLGAESLSDTSGAADYSGPDRRRGSEPPPGAVRPRR